MRRGVRLQPVGRANPDGSSLERADAKLLSDVDRGFDRARRAAGEHLACAAGCDACCHGPFPITTLDAWRLRREMRRLQREDPARAARLRSRARKAWNRLRSGFPGNARDGRFDADRDLERLDRYLARHAGMPCPALDPGRGTCELYAARPVACRTFGPPLDFASVASAPCELCFAGADRETLDRCRFEPDPGGREDRLLALLGDGRSWETLIARALIDETDSGPRRAILAQ